VRDLLRRRQQDVAQQKAGHGRKLQVFTSASCPNAQQNVSHTTIGRSEYRRPRTSSDRQKVPSRGEAQSTGDRRKKEAEIVAQIRTMVGDEAANAIERALGPETATPIEQIGGTD
jgi:hypothetical protein